MNVCLSEALPPLAATSPTKIDPPAPNGAKVVLGVVLVCCPPPESPPDVSPLPPGVPPVDWTVPNVTSISAAVPSPTFSNHRRSVKRSPGWSSSLPVEYDLSRISGAVSSTFATSTVTLVETSCGSPPCRNVIVTGWAWGPGSASPLTTSSIATAALVPGAISPSGRLSP